MGTGELLGISIPIWIFAIVAVGGYLALHKNPLGRFVYAIGGNLEAARLAGVNVKRVLVSVYVLIGCLAGWRALFSARASGERRRRRPISFELRVIASVVIGGTSLMGGYGRIGGTIISSIIMGILINGTGVDERLGLLPADYHRVNYRSGGGVRHLRQEPSRRTVRITMKEVRIGLIGTGYIGKAHAIAYAWPLRYSTCAASWCVRWWPR